jgi:hypothetical protein
MADSTISVSFSASVGDLISGVSEAKEALSSLAEPSQALSAQYRQLRESLLTAFDATPIRAYGDSLNQLAALQKGLEAARAQASNALRDGDEAAYRDITRAEQLAMREEIEAVRDALKEKLEALSEEVHLHQITADEKVRLARQALDKEYTAEASLLVQESQLGAASLAQKAQLLNQQLQADRRYLDQRATLTREALDAEYRDYDSFGNTITGSFSGQIRGLLSGTETWRNAFRAALEDLTIKFIEWTENSVVQYLAGEAAKTIATTTGVAERTSAEQAGATASLATQAASMVRSILSSAAEAFAGVFGFLAPVLGPAAAGPAAGAYGTVAGMAGAVASADIGMWQVPQDMLTLVHHNELIMPSSEAGAFRSMLSGVKTEGSNGASVQINPAVHLSVQAVDSSSVSQWMRNNSGHMLKAIDEAVRHGAAIGTRRLRNF